MFLRSLRLTNVRGHRDLVLPVTRRAGDPDHPLTESRRWTLILGESDRLEGSTQVGPLTANTTFVLVAEGPGGRAGASVRVTVAASSPG